MKTHLGWAFPDSDEFMVSELKPDGTYQAPNLTAALRHVTDHSLAIDGGAHVGTWSRIMSHAFARVIAVEPCADTFEALLVNLATFGCRNVEPRRIALGQKARDVAMVLDGKGANMRNTGARHVDHAKQSAGERVPCQPIDDWHLPTLGFLKLDVEGSEVEALLGAKRTIDRCRPVILFENKGLWKQFGYPRDWPQQWLPTVGYRLAEAVSCDQIWVPK